MADKRTPISVNIITKDQPESTLRCVASVVASFIEDGDEILLLDTGSDEKNLEALRAGASEYPDGLVRVISRPDLTVDLRPYIEKWLDPKLIEDWVGDEQYANAKGLLSFADARQVVQDESKNPIIFWIDSDDILADATEGKLREIVEDNLGGDAPKVAQFFMDYQYAFAEDGTCTTILKRERFFLKDNFKWRGRCHETPIPIPGKAGTVAYCRDMPAYIRHTKSRKPSKVSDIRNYIILRNEVEETDGPIDPRTLFYLANAARGVERFREALNLYAKFYPQSGSVDDRYCAALYSAGIYMQPISRRPLCAIDWYQRCIELKPGDPRGYFGLQRCYMAMQQFDVSLHWYRVGCALPEPKQQFHSYNPHEVNYTNHVLAAQAAEKLDDTEFGLQCLDKALRARPNEEEIRGYIRGLTILHNGQQLTSAIEHVCKHTQNKAEGMALARKIANALPAAPKQLERHGIGRTEGLEVRPDAPDVAIWCGEAPEEWGPDAGKDGIGGSEKMILLLAPELQRRGYNVTVYVNVPAHQRGVDEKTGVCWAHWSEFDPDRKRYALVSWRNPEAATMKCRAEKRILWCHDVQDPARYTPEVIASIDYVQLQSEYHAEPLRGVVPDEKIWIARNAIHPAHFPPLTKEGKAARDPKKILFMSSPDRGLLTSLLIVKAAQQVDPDLRMTVMYGFTPYFRKAAARWNHRHIPDLGRDGSLDDYERAVWQLMDETNSVMLHRVGFQKVAEELRSAGCWLYPTRFPEISCMGAMEAQAAGCWPVSTRYGALDETVLFGTELPPLEGVGADPKWVADAAEKLLEATRVTPEQREEMAEAARRKFEVGDLADQWVERIGLPAGNQESGSPGGGRSD